MILALPTWLVASLLTGALGLLSALYFGWTRYYCKVLQENKPFDDLPMPPNSHWLLGQLRNMGGDFRISQPRLTRDYCNKHGQTGYWMMSTKIVAVTDCDDARVVLNTTTYRKPIPLFRRHVNQFLGPRNIGFLSGKEWRFHRSSIVRAFTPAALHEAQPGILKVMSALLASLQDLGNRHEEDKPIQRDIGALMKMITIDIFGQTALSRDLGCCRTLQPSPIAVAFDFMGDEMSRRMFHSSSVADFFYWIPTRRNRQYQQERKVLRDFLGDLVQERLAISKNDRPNDLLNGLLRGMEEGAKDMDSSLLCENTISDVLMALLFAGYDTTSITLTYALYHIATVPEVEQACLAEIAQADITDPDALQYCKAVLLETLRLYPPGVITTRTSEKPLKLNGGVTVPADTFFMIPIWTIQHMEEHFERPEEFHPERWARQDENGAWEERPEDDNDAVHSGGDNGGIPPANRKAFLAFSGGARSCAGSKFAMIEAVLVFAQLVKHFSFELPSDYDLYPLRVGLVQRPRDDMVMTMKWRQ